ncbi:MAG: ABC transporter substrate-binding protein [Actinomycetes bacterium]
MAPLPFRRTAALSCAAVLAAGCATPSLGDTSAGHTPKVVRVGLLIPGSGSDVEPQTPAEEGAQLAVDLVNDAQPSVPVPLAAGLGIPGLDGARVELVVDRRADAMSTAQVERLVTDRAVDVLVGAGGTEDVLATSQRAEQLGVPYIGGGSTSSFLTERGLEWFFHTAPSDEALGQAFAGLLERRPDRYANDRVAVLYPEDQKGAAVAHDLRDALATRGYESALAPVPPPRRDEAGSGAAALSRAMATGDVSGVVLVGRDPASAQAAARAATSAIATTGAAPAAVLGIGAGFAGVAAAATRDDQGEEAAWGDQVARGDQADLRDSLPGLLAATPWSAESAEHGATSSSVAELYRGRFGRAMGAEAAEAFTATYTAIRGVEQARSVDPEQVRAALAALDIPGRELVMQWDGVRFDARHRNVAARGTFEQLTADGPHLVEPEDLARTPVRWGTDAERDS